MSALMASPGISSGPAAFPLVGALDNVQTDVFLLGSKLGCDDAGVDRFPANECPMCLRCQHQGQPFSTGGGGGGFHPCPEYSSCSPDESLSVLIVATLSHSVLALRSCSFSSPLLLGWFFLSIHRPDAPCGYSRCCPGCQKGSQPCSFLSALTAPHHKSPR